MPQDLSKLRLVRLHSRSREALIIVASTKLVVLVFEVAGKLAIISMVDPNSKCSQTVSEVMITNHLFHEVMVVDSSKSR